MTQEFPTTAKIIYDTLSNDAKIVELLGYYRFRESGTRSFSALSIVSPGEDLPSLRSVEGIECIIQDVGDTKKFEYLTKDLPRLRTTWSVFLVAWEPAKGSDLQAATEAILARFLGSESVQTVATADGLGSLVQTKILIKSDMPIVPK